MYGSKRISIEVFRDVETPEIPIDAVIAGLKEVRTLVPTIEVVARNGLMRISDPGTEAIHTKSLPILDIETDFGMIITGRPIVIPPSAASRIAPGNLVVGNTLPTGLNKPFSIIDAARARFPRQTTKHELGHLFKIPHEGERFDGDCHCTDRKCVMHAISQPERDDFCGRCAKQLGRSALGLSILKTRQ